METFLDLLWGNTFLGILGLTGLLAGSMFLIIYPSIRIGKRKDYKYTQKLKTRDTILIFAGMGGFFVLMIGYIAGTSHYNPHYWGYGRAHNFHFASMDGNKLLLHDYLEVNSKSSSTSYTRLSVVDANTGKREFKGMLGERVELKYRQGDTLWYIGRKCFTIFDTKNLKILLQIYDNDLKQIPEFGKGIKYGYNQSIENIAWKGQEILVTTLDGYRYWFNPFTKQPRLYKEEPKPQNHYQQPSQQITITIDNGDGAGKYNPYPNRNLSADTITRYFMKSSPTAPLRQILVAERAGKEQVLNPTLTFLRAEILHVDYLNKYFIIKHFETTEAKPHEFILACVDKDGKVLWEKRRRDFACFDFSSFWGKYDFHRSILDRNKLILTFGGFIYALDLKTGNKIWENRL